MKQNIDIAFLSAEWDPEKQDFDDCFGVTKSERMSFLCEVRRRLLKDDKPVADIFVEMVREELVPGRLFLAFAAFGAQEAWETFGDGVSLALAAAEEIESPRS